MASYHSARTVQNNHFLGNTSSSSYVDPPDSAYETKASGGAAGSAYRHSMDSAQRPSVSVQVLRCMRCARQAEALTTDDLSTVGMVQVGHGIFYCHRCAKLVGYT